MSFKIELAEGQSINDHWYSRCLLDAFNGRHQTLFLILCAMKRRTRDELSLTLDAVFPRFGDACRISANGIVHAKYQVTAGGLIDVRNIGTTKDIEGALRRCADRVKLGDNERRQLFRTFNDWIEKDDRATSEV